jgi:hypothetical protein
MDQSMLLHIPHWQADFSFGNIRCAKVAAAKLMCHVLSIFNTLLVQIFQCIDSRMRCCDTSVTQNCETHLDDFGNSPDRHMLNDDDSSHS